MWLSTEQNCQDIIQLLEQWGVQCRLLLPDPAEDAEPLEAVRAELEDGGAECLAMPCDVREPEQVRSLLDATLERFGSVDVLVNNAGGQFAAPAEEISANGWRAVHRLALDAAWDLCHQVARRSMIPGEGGLVVFIGFSPRRGIPEFAHASAARAALENLAAGLAIEWSRYAIRSVCVALGNIEIDPVKHMGRAAAAGIGLGDA